MAKKITVIGGSGFVGTNLCRQLSLKQQDFKPGLAQAKLIDEPLSRRVNRARWLHLVLLAPGCGH